MIAARLILAFGLGICGSALAQSSPTGGFTFTSSNIVTPTNPTTLIELWAWFDYLPGQAEMFAGTTTNIAASDGGWSKHTNVLAGNFPSPPPPPPPTGSKILNIVTGQIHFPPLFFAMTDNPILLYTAEWSTNDFTPRDVSLETLETTKFTVYMNQQGASLQLPPSSIFEGSGVIRVVPAPPGALIAACGLLALQRRR